VTTDAQLLRFPARTVRPQGRSAGGMAGVKLAAGAHAAFFGVVDPAREALVVTSAGTSGALPGTEGGSLKVTPYAEYPSKGRATGGVRCHRFLKGEDTLVLAFAGNTPVRAAAANGVAIELPPADGRRDGSGLATSAVIAQVASPPPREQRAAAAPAAAGGFEEAEDAEGTGSSPTVTTQPTQPTLMTLPTEPTEATGPTEPTGGSDS
jgi:DNA gyrase subunit A